MEKRGEQERCPACGRPFKRQKGLFLHALTGSIIGLSVGIGFVIYWFGVYAGFFHTMALVHEVAGTFLGLLAGLIVGTMKRR